MIKTKNYNIYIVMYHYVREIKKSKYPNIKGLEFEDFKKQINYFLNNFNILSNDDFAEIVRTKKIPKKKSILLTFDDGYKDHWKYVYPYLKKKKISGNFYPPVKVIENKKVLDVNKIHFILEKEEDREKLLKLIFRYVKKFMNKSVDELRINKISTKSKYDDKNTIIIKKLLQYYLPLKIREKILNKLFKSVIGLDEKKFSKILYMNSKNIIEMYKDKMVIGSHGDYHLWWEKTSYKSKLNEIRNSINFFKKIEVYDHNFSVCYPYGSYDLDTLKILKQYNVNYALTTKVGSISYKNIDKFLELPRLDANDFKQ